MREVMSGWGQGVRLMVVGESRRLWIPATLTYEGTGALTADVELLSISPGPRPPPTPADVHRPPAAAKRTESGLAYRVLQRGAGKERPGAASRVRLQYASWTADGRMFDSSIVTEEPATVDLAGAIAGWREGVQLMVAGDRMRFWIPAELAHGDRPDRAGAPAGMLVSEIELLEIL